MIIALIKKFDWKRLQNRYFFGGLFVIVLILGGLFFLTRKGQSDIQNQVAISEVSVSSIAGLSSSSGDIPLFGKVQSASEVAVRAEAGGLVTSVNYKLGDYVGAGSIIANIENASQRNDVERAQSMVDTASSQFKSGSASLDETRRSLINTVKSSYTSADDATHNHIDNFFANGTYKTFPQFQLKFVAYSINPVDSTLMSSSEVKRTDLEKKLTKWQDDLSKLDLNSKDDSAIQAQVAEAESNLTAVRDLLDKLAALVNQVLIDNVSFKPMVDGYKADISGTRSSVNNALSSLISIFDAYNSKKAIYVSSDSAGKATSELSIEQARIALNQSQIALDKTYIRSPINGTLNNFDLSVGDYLSSMQQVAIVSNNNALEILTYISENDRLGVSLGNSVLINDKIKGVVTSVAPALDPITKKIEVKIGLPGDMSELINGQSVNLSLAREKNKEASTVNLKQLTVPLSALKVEPDRMVVFSVSASSTLVAHVVKDGPIVGDKIIISGVDPSLEIITDARGLQEGDLVKIGSNIKK